MITVAPDDTELMAVLGLLRRFGNWKASDESSSLPDISAQDEVALDEAVRPSIWLSFISHSATSGPGPVTGIVESSRVGLGGFLELVIFCICLN